MSAGSVVPTPVSEDPYTNPDSHHKTQVEPDSFAFGQTIVTTSQSGRYFSDGGASNNVFSTSTNGGRTWTTGGLPGTTVHAIPPGPWARISDPAIAYDPEHNVWLAQGLALQGGIGRAVIVNRSTDGGLTWQNPVNVATSPGTFWDKTWIACDVWPQSPHYGNCYSQWDEVAPNEMMMSTSTDGGVTWSAPQSPPVPSGLGGQPVVLPNGTVVVPYTGNFSGIYAFRSTNGGASWTSAVSITSQSTHGVAGDMRDPPLPSAEVDGGGRVYVVWHDCRFRSGCSANDIVMTTSTDGVSWTPVVRIPIDPVDSNRDHFLPGIGADRATSGSGAHLGLGYYYYPVSNCGSNCQLTYGFISSLDGGATWSNPQQVTAPMNPTWLPYTTGWGRMVGDYTSTSFTADGKAFTVYSVAKRPPSGTCDIGVACSQRMAMSRFDITAPPFEPRIRARRDTVRYFRPHRPDDEPFYPRTD